MEKGAPNELDGMLINEAGDTRILDLPASKPQTLPGPRLESWRAMQYLPVQLIYQRRIHGDEDYSLKRKHHEIMFCTSKLGSFSLVRRSGGIIIIINRGLESDLMYKAPERKMMVIHLKLNVLFQSTSLVAAVGVA